MISNRHMLVIVYWEDLLALLFFGLDLPYAGKNGLDMVHYDCIVFMIYNCEYIVHLCMCTYIHIEKTAVT